MYELAADLTLIVHFAFIIFVVFGALLFFVSTKIIKTKCTINVKFAAISYIYLYIILLKPDLSTK